MKRMLGLILSLTLAGAFAAGSEARTAPSSPRSGVLHVTKECPDYHGLAGEHCTILSSNLNSIRGGMNVVYISPAGATSLDSDLVLDGPGNNNALGHVTLDFATRSGIVTFSGGTGRFRGFHARVAVTYSTDDGLWHWDGTYRFTPPGQDD